MIFPVLGRPAIDAIPARTGGSVGPGVPGLFLPAYSRELYLIERPWKVTKRCAFSGGYLPTYRDFQAAIPEVLGALPSKYSQQPVSWMTRIFQQFDAVSLMAAQGISPNVPVPNTQSIWLRFRAIFSHRRPPPFGFTGTVLLAIAPRPTPHAAPAGSGRTQILPRWLLPDTHRRIQKDLMGPDLDERPLYFSMSPNQAIPEGKSIRFPHSPPPTVDHPSRQGALNARDARDLPTIMPTVPESLKFRPFPCCFTWVDLSRTAGPRPP